MRILKRLNRRAVLRTAGGVLVLCLLTACPCVFADSGTGLRPYADAVVSPVRAFMGNIVGNYFLADLRDRDPSGEELAVRMDEISRLLCDPAVLSKEWLGNLHRSGVIEGALFMTGSRTLAVGREFLPQFSQSPGYYIDGEGFLHFRCSVSEGAFLDTVVSLSNLNGKKRSTAVRGAALVDTGTGSAVVIHGDGASLEDPDFLAEHGSRFIGPARAVIVEKVFSAENDILLVTDFRFVPGPRSWRVFGLLVLAVFAIFIFISTIRAIRYFYRTEKRGLETGAGMGDKKKKSVISEIDSEISDIIDDDTVRETPPPDDSKLIERKKKYEDDGIIIRRGA